MLSAVEQTRLQVSKSTDAKKKSQFGQFLTPATTTAFMAGLFPPADGDCYLLDAGAGIGSLSAAFLERWRRGELHFRRVDVDAFEIDSDLHDHLAQTLAKYTGRNCTTTVRAEDFVHSATDVLSGGLFAASLPKYSHAILNPPYKKISSSSAHRIALRRVGVETVNLYSAFVALALALVAPGGQVVAILPRSFCNGPYYRPFREFILGRGVIHHIHLFGSRTNAFKDDGVLQENVIIRLERDGEQGPVVVSTSSDDTFADLASLEHPFERIVFPGDPERFIHVPTSAKASAIELLPVVRYTLDDLGLQVSTGPVVDFRLKEHLRDMPGSNTVPLLYPGHFSSGHATWPIQGLKKPNAIVRNADTEKWLYPNGFYCVVRRFSSKEEARRIVASLVDPRLLGDVSVLGFENHLNLFHQKRGGLSEALARGLVVFLNTTAVDEHFRRFNGHTQVNATDLKLIKYPSRDILIKLGEWAARHREISQSMIDHQFETLTA